MDPSVDVFVLTEIGVTSFQTNQFSLNGYKAFFHTRDNKRGGGIAFYVKKRWLLSASSISFQHAETKAVKKFHPDFSLFILAVYRLPSENVSLFLEELKVILRDLRSEGPFCLVGDMNIDTLKPNKSTVCDYLTLLSEYGIECTISFPTREEVMSGELVISCNDHIDVRASDHLIKSAVITQKLSDHYFIECHFQCQAMMTNMNTSNTPCVTITDTNKLDALVAAFDWDEFLRSNEGANLYLASVELWQSFQSA